MFPQDNGKKGKYEINLAQVVGKDPRFRPVQRPAQNVIDFSVRHTTVEDSMFKYKVLHQNNLFVQFFKSQLLLDGTLLTLCDIQRSSVVSVVSEGFFSTQKCIQKMTVYLLHLQRPLHFMLIFHIKY